jgi:hypothetical protein
VETPSSVHHVGLAVEDLDGALDTYERLFEQCATGRYRMEATPGYFHGGPRLIRGIRTTLREPRVVILLRDPVARIWSIYRYAKSHLLLAPDVSFESYIEKCRQVDSERKLRPIHGQAYWSIRASHYADYIVPWLEDFGEDLRILFFEDLASSPREVVERLCEWLGIDPGPVRSFELSVENKSIRYRSRSLQRLALAVNRNRFLRRNRNLKERVRNLYFRVNDRGGKESMPDPVRRDLELTFSSPNRRLADALVARGYTELPPWLTREPASSATG